MGGPIEIGFVSSSIKVQEIKCPTALIVQQELNITEMRDKKSENKKSKDQPPNTKQVSRLSDGEDNGARDDSERDQQQDGMIYSGGPIGRQRGVDKKCRQAKATHRFAPTKPFPFRRSRMLVQ